MTEPLYVSLLWHMHQPFYKDPVRGEYILPWAYLHAVKDYYDMPAIVDATPGARVVFNLVPSLLEQILDYACGAAIDPFLARMRMAPADLDEADRIFILENFFSANRQRMIEPYRRYLELYVKAGKVPRVPPPPACAPSPTRTSSTCRSGSTSAGPARRPDGAFPSSGS